MPCQSVYVKKRTSIKSQLSHLQVFIFLHKKCLSVVAQLHVQVNGLSIDLNVYLKSVTHMCIR